jgi:polyisoprenoid-binding protein YceI
VKLTGKDTAQVSGDLFLHGVTRPLTATVSLAGMGKDPYGGTRAGFEATFTLKRSEFGMTFMQDGLSDEVQVIVSVEGVKG